MVEVKRQTARLTLRSAVADDAGAVWQFRRLESVGRWMTRSPTSFDAFRDQFTDPASLAMTLVIEREGEAIGDLALDVEDGWAQAEVADQARGVQASLGWVLHPDWTGQGYATEAVEELLRICFEDLGLRRVTAACFADNKVSWRLMERVGMTRWAHSVQDSLHRSGEWLDSYGYALLADDWKAAQGRLGAG